jgi:hypothetical protein
MNPRSIQHPFACWHRCRRNPRPGRTCGRRDRVAWDQSCCPHPPSGYGTARIASGRCQKRFPRGRGDPRGGLWSHWASGMSLSYLEEVGTLLSIACHDASALRSINQGSRSRCSRRAHLSRPPSAKPPLGDSGLESCLKAGEISAARRCFSRSSSSRCAGSMGEMEAWRHG